MDTDTTMRAGASPDVGGTVRPVMQQLQEKAGVSKQESTHA